MYPLLVPKPGLLFRSWLDLAGASPARRRWILMLGVADPGERSRLLRLGFGDALSEAASLEELEQRVLRVVEHAQTLPRMRQCGPLRLDLLAREAFVSGRALGLHPREFALLWRLSDSPGEAVGAGELIADIWRLAFRPETNSLAVHVSRLRAKLRLAGIDGLIATGTDGSYRLQLPGMAPPPPKQPELPLDGYLRLSKEWSEPTDQIRQDDNHAA
jgi:DNA-binding response OmpR family regulator